MHKLGLKQAVDLAVKNIVFFYCFFTSHVHASIKVPCPPDWVQSHLSGTCIRLKEQTKSWDDARDACNLEYADLLKILDSEMNQFVSGLLKKKTDAYYIGLTKLRGSLGYTWRDEKEMANFHMVKHTSVNRACVTINEMHAGKGDWSVVNCSARKKFICEKSDFKLCPEGYIISAHSGSCIKLLTQRLVWLESRTKCQEHGGDLAMINNNGTSHFLLDQMNQHPNIPAWIGLNDLKEEGQFHWNDFSDAVQYTDWDIQQPNNRYGLQHCVTINHNQRRHHTKWHDVKCGDLNLGFCEVFSDCKYQPFGMFCPANCKETKCGGPRKLCSPVSGSCAFGCGPGYLGQMCDTPCTLGDWGQNCTQNCSSTCGGRGNPCHPENGQCTSGCLKGYVGEYCDKDEKQMHLKLGGAFVSFVFLLLVVVLVYSFLCGKQEETKKESITKDHESHRDSVFSGDHTGDTPERPTSASSFRSSVFSDVTGIEPERHRDSDEMKQSQAVT